MELKLIREQMNDVCTIGKLFVNNKAFCNTLEDVVREDGEMVEGETAIPEGTYNITVTAIKSNANIKLPTLNDVPNFEDVYIQYGVTNTEVDGDIIVGIWDRKTQNSISNSRELFRQLFKKIKTAISDGEEVTITIQNGR